MIVKNYEVTENNEGIISVEITAEEFEAAVNRAYLKNKSSIAIPGFRKGKAPRAVIEGIYGKEVFYQDAMDEQAQPAFEYGVRENKVKFVGSPAISDVQVGEDKSVDFSFKVTLYPQVTLGQYKGVEVEKPAEEVTDEAVAAEIESVRKRNARMISVDDRAAQMGDTVNIDFDGFLDGERFEGGKAEGYSLELGSGSFVPGFEEQVVGMQLGEEKDLDITFPEKYAADLAGKAVVFKVKLNEITYAELPELDDEFAKDVSEFDTLDEYKASVKEKLEKTAKENGEAQVRNEAMRIAADNMTVTIPAVMVDEKLDEMLRSYAGNYGMTDRKLTTDQLKEALGINDEIMNGILRPQAEMQVKTDLLVEAVAEAEDFQISDEDKAEYVTKLAESMKASADDIKSYFGEEFLAAEQKKELASKLIVDSAVVKEAVAAAE